MSEERLIEITSEIMKTDGTLGKIAYISSLSKDEKMILCSYVSDPIYKGLDIYSRLLKFSYVYLESKNISILNINADEQQEVDARQVLNSYLENMLLGDDEISISSDYKIKR